MPPSDGRNLTPSSVVPGGLDVYSFPPLPWFSAAIHGRKARSSNFFRSSAVPCVNSRRSFTANVFGVFRVRQKALHRRIRLLRIRNGSLCMFIIANVEFGLRHTGEGEAGDNSVRRNFDPVLIGLG